MEWDYYRAYRDGLLIAEGDTPVPDEVLAEAHEIHWLMKAHLIADPEMPSN